MAKSLMPLAKALVPWCIAAALSGCAVGPDFHRPAAPTDTAYAPTPVSSGPIGAGADAQQLVADLRIPDQWWSLFASAKLDQLVAEALRANPDVQAARAALRQAHELYLAQRTALLPTVAGGFSGTRAKYPIGTITPATVAADPTYNLYTAQLTVSYLPDIFGGVRRANEAALAQAQGARFQLEATYLTLSSNVVVTVIQEASLRGQIEATERLLQLQRQLLSVVQQQRGAGTASELDLLTQQSLMAQTAATLPPLRKQLGQTRDELTALMGRLPAHAPVEQFALSDLTLPHELPLSLPSALVRQRPDVRVAEENLHAASAQVGVALADMLPQFSIDGTLGSSALQMSGLFGPYTGFWSLGGSLTQTLFDAGSLLHHKRAADAALDQAAAQYRAAVILACQNVADALQALREDAAALEADTTAAAAAQRTLDLTEHQRELGTASTTAVIAAEQSYQQAVVNLVQAQSSRFADSAALFQALGGGWWTREGGKGQ
ncbi:MAG TPA: efflux transporter outer membrane subunit [Steroidobacteraceae bacterium]|jgi:NodT family efflux transporter outer membrane factor (OMF) lipoprotein|nr:efflux transporter outer membrane subunit [Steroidobacteraceae bacterium]